MPSFRPVLAVAALAIAAATPALTQPTTPMPTKDFVMAAAGSDQFEIDAAYDALAQSHDARVRAFAREMIQDHTRTREALTRAAAMSGLPAPSKAISDDGAKFLAQIQSLTGQNFDQAYAKTQVLAHEAALVTEKGYARDGSDPNVRMAAQSATPIIARHLAMAQKLRSNVNGL